MAVIYLYNKFGDVTRSVLINDSSASYKNAISDTQSNFMILSSTGVSSELAETFSGC